MAQMLLASSAISYAPGFLVLRVRGSSRDGQLVRLQSPKCTIGSGPNCTLRLRADNVGAVHCLILRGPNRTVVRRWSPDTRLNGRNFTESELQSGDCLSIGAIELEVVETAQSGLPSENLREQQRTVDQQLAQIETRLQSLDEQQAECNATQADFQARQSELDSLRAQWESQHAATQQQLVARGAELEALDAELRSRGAMLDEERRQWETSHNEWTVRRAAEAEQLAARQTDLEARGLEFEKLQAEWETQRAEITEGHAAREAGLQQLRVEVELARTALDEQRRQWELERDDALTSRSTETDQLAARQAEFDAQRRVLDEQQAVWETQKAELQQLRAEVESTRTALDEQHRQWELERDDAFTSRSTETDQLAARQAELDAQRRALEVQQSAWEAEKSAWEARQVGVQQTLDDRVAGLDALRVDLESQRLALEKEQRQYEAQLAELQSRECEMESRRREMESGIAVPAVVSVVPVSEPAASTWEPPVAESREVAKPVVEVETVRSFVPPNAAPVDLAAILRRTGFQIEQADEIDPVADEEQSRENIDLKNESLDSGTAESPSIDISAPMPRSREPAEPREEEVSIDEYMANLLARSRGESAASPTPAAAPPRPSPAAVVPAPQSEPFLPGEPAEMTPRTVAPEKHVDFRAMRQLANVSAKNALHKHESKRLSVSTHAKLLVTSVSLVVGASLLVIHQLPGASPITIYGAVASFAVAALWGVNYLALMSQMARERMAYMSRHLKVGEEPVVEVKEENP